MTTHSTFRDYRVHFYAFFQQTFSKLFVSEKVKKVIQKQGQGRCNDLLHGWIVVAVLSQENKTFFFRWLIINNTGKTSIIVERHFILSSKRHFFLTSKLF